MGIFESTERDLSSAGSDALQYASMMKRGWETGCFWFSLALDSPAGLHSLIYDHVQPRFSKTHADEAPYYLIVSQYWTTNADKFVATKVKDKEDYDLRLRLAFEEP